MKTKTTCISVLALTGLLWACWSFAYQRGYSRGARDEFACWKQVPPSGSQIVITGRRDMWTLPGGKPPPAHGVYTIMDYEPSVNKIPSKVFP